jgi:hypothetical protein
VSTANRTLLELLKGAVILEQNGEDFTAKENLLELFRIQLN